MSVHSSGLADGSRMAEMARPVEGSKTMRTLSFAEGNMGEGKRDLKRVTQGSVPDGRGRDGFHGMTHQSLYGWTATTLMLAEPCANSMPVLIHWVADW
jgi:hypothetical protein